MPRYCAVLTAMNVDSCPLYDKGDRIVLHLPEVDMDSSNKICAFLLAELLSKKTPKEKNMVCEAREEFPNKQAYASEFQISEGILHCPRVSTQVTFDVKIEDALDSLGDLQEFTGRADKKQIVAKLKSIPILSALSLNDLFDLLSEIKMKKYEPGHIIIEKGTPGRNFFIIYQGEVEVIHPFKEGVETVIGRLKSGECFGEMSLLSGDPVSATIRACTSSTILLIGHVTFRRILEKNPVMVSMFIKILSERIKSTNHRMSMVVASGMAGQLQTIRFPELVQTLCSTECSGILHINHQGQQGKVYFQSGAIVDATIQESGGENCFYEMLKWNQGDFRFEQKDIPERTRTILCDTIGLLLEGMRRIDEENRISAETQLHE